MKLFESLKKAYTEHLFNTCYPDLDLLILRANSPYFDSSQYSDTDEAQLTLFERTVVEMCPTKYQQNMTLLLIYYLPFIYYKLPYLYISPNLHSHENYIRNNLRDFGIVCRNLTQMFDEIGISPKSDIFLLVRSISEQNTQPEVITLLSEWYYKLSKKSDIYPQIQKMYLTVCIPLWISSDR